MNNTTNIDPAEIAHVHLDAVGGVAGDMFAAAMLDVIPGLWPACQQTIAALTPPPGVSARPVPHSDGTLTGCRFDVGGVDEDHHAATEAVDHDHHHEHDHHHHDDHDHHRSRHHHGHHHHAWASIRDRIARAALEDETRRHTLEIFSRLAEAEGAVHGIAPDDVTFHEVGAWDSIIDIAVAGTLIASLPKTCTWSVGALPRGRGLVKTAHGMLPLPAPATERLLRGFEIIDDGEDGERITPTGAAIIAHLKPNQMFDRTPRRLLAAGSGFGTKRLRHRSNILRASLYAKAALPSSIGADTVEVLRCEIDDQSPEDLAIALERIRAEKGVLDVCQWPVFAKKGRMATAVQVLAHPDAGNAVLRLLLDETTTLGVRRTLTAREIIMRESREADGVEVKLANRPSGITAKAAADASAATPTHRARAAARLNAEQAALKAANDRSNDASD